MLRIFNRKDFYSVHGDDATFVARAFYKTTTVVKYLVTASPPCPASPSP